MNLVTRAFTHTLKFKLYEGSWTHGDRKCKIDILYYWARDTKGKTMGCCLWH
jgi:hypothetical protein